MSPTAIIVLIVLAVFLIGAFLYFRNRNTNASSGGAPIMPPASIPRRRDDIRQEPPRGGDNTPTTGSTAPPPPPQATPSAPPQVLGGNLPSQDQIDSAITEILGNLDKKMEKGEDEGDIPAETTTSTGAVAPVPPAQDTPAPKPAPPSAPITPAPGNSYGGVSDDDDGDGFADVDEEESLEADMDFMELEREATLEDEEQESIEPIENEKESTPDDSLTLAGSVDDSAAYFLSTCPKSMPLDEWQPMYAYVFRPSAAAQVYADASKLLGKKQAEYSTLSQPASTTIREGAEITATPELAGFQFKPLRVTVGFYDTWERFNFELRAKSAPLNQFATGRIVFTVEGLIVGEVPLSVFVGETPAEWEFKDNTTKMYQAIFCSYSHTDTKIIERLERAYKSLGMDYLRDITTLKSGTHWSDELLALIDRADVFQLFWSKTAAESPYVKQEWEHALKYETDRPNFIRPVWWQDPMPPVPKELGHIHFWHQPDLDDED
ncbi:MAG: toll/interleukin-1 receptor domain-containing protein [Aggregatilineales bacterium]